MFSLKVVGSTKTMSDHLDLANRLESRIKISPQEYDEIMTLREKTHNMRDYDPKGAVIDDAGTYYLERVDEMYRRSYRVVGE
jgi:hydroxymethylglutaryl-CoA synthase